jgi:hypothetical protein
MEEIHAQPARLADHTSVASLAEFRAARSSRLEGRLHRGPIQGRRNITSSWNRSDGVNSIYLHAHVWLRPYKSINYVRHIESHITRRKSRVSEGVQDFMAKSWLPPVNQINASGMPLQDAIDLAVFLASVQIEMERYLPGTPLCGGAIDVIVVHGRPRWAVEWFPGKETRHPRR